MRFLRSAMLLFASAWLASACSAPAEGPPPGLALATSLLAQNDLRPLMKRWVNALTREERAALGPDLEAFVRKHERDGQLPAAEALLAWIAVEKGQLDLALKLSRKAQALGPGSWQDFATLVEGAVRHRSGNAKGAITLLSPLRSALIDAWARDLLDEELIFSAIAAGDSKLALGTMSVWLREAGDDERALVRSRVERALAALGNAELVKIFDERTARKSAPTDTDLDLLLVKRLARLAIDARDAVLAKKLLFTSGPLLGDQGDAVARLAAGAAAIRVDARTIGLLLSFRTAEARRRSAEVAAGVAWGLELPGSGARLAVRDDAGEPEHLEEALTELGRDGAALVIAGVGDADARAAITFAEQQHVPVILLSGPEGAAPPAAPSFVLALGASEPGWLPEKDPRFNDGQLDAWVNAHGTAPSFWSAAGRDAAVLARASVSELPQEATEDRTEVEARRKTVRAALESAKVWLWTH